MNDIEKIELICVDCGELFLADAKLDKLPKRCDMCKNYKKIKPKKLIKEQPFGRFKASKRLNQSNSKLLLDVSQANAQGVSYGVYKARGRLTHDYGY